MKKTIVLCALMLAGASAFGQESRQDISLSGVAILAPTVHGNAVTETPTITGGVLASYRYLLTPRSGLELNYSFAQYTEKFQSGGQAVNTYNPIHVRQQELSAAYVYGRTYGNYTPFLEAGVGGMVFTPILEGSFSLDAKQNTAIAGLFGGGVAYEISPSFDVRLQYRGLLVKAPDFHLSGNRFNTGRYQVISMPAIGIAYHF
jgi:outer membrane immunogenic protein